jgi:VCBS repeat-containing protein
MSIQKRAKLVPWLAAFAVMVMVAMLTVPSLAATSTPMKSGVMEVRGPTADGTTTNHDSYVKLGTAKVFSVKLTNGTPSGNSSFLSATITTPLRAPATSETQNFSFTAGNDTRVSLDTAAGTAWTATWLDVNGAVRCSKGSAVATCAPLPSGVVAAQGKVYIQNLSPIKPTKSTTVTVRMDVTGVADCPDSRATPLWNADLRTGGNLSGDTFPLTSSLSKGEQTHVLTTCAPVASNDSYSTDEDTQLNVTAPGVLSNDTGSSLSAVKQTDPANGTVTLSNDGSFTYTPNANYSGSDSFTYKANDGTTDSGIASVTITVNAVDDAPVAVDDGPYDAVSGVGFTVSATATSGVLANDTDIDSTSLTASVVDQPSHGALSLNANGGFTYTADATYDGPDSFTYKANDGTSYSNAATVSLDVWADSIPCNGSITVGTGANIVTIANVDTTDCQAATVTATFDGDELNIDKPAGDQVVLRIGIDAWNRELAKNPVPATTVKPPAAGEPGVWCNGGPDVDPSMPSGHSWCLIEQHTVLAGQNSDGKQMMQVYEDWLLDGDALACRTCK